MSDLDKLITIFQEVGVHFIVINNNTTLIVRGTVDECEIDFDYNGKLISNEDE